MDTSMHNKHYWHLLVMTVLSFISMYVFMYAMVDVFANVIPNFNQFYMAGLMTAPMIVIELFVMRSMYMNKKLNAGIIGACVIALVVFFMLIRQQTAIGDTQFLKSMIPHHAAAILMCKQAPIQDLEIKALCERIVSGQQSEIDWMKAKLNELKKSDTSPVSGATTSSVSIVSYGGSVQDLVSLIDHLRGNGLTVTPGKSISQPFFSVQGQQTTVGTETIQIYEYADAKAMETEASKVSPDGGSVGTSMMSWVGPPHFFKQGRILILYVGSDKRTLDALNEALGAQFAGH